jgi:glutaredoxin
MSKTHLIMYSRSFGCPFITVAKNVLSDYHVPYTEILIDKDAQAKARVIAWTGFQSVPTLVVAREGEQVPYTDVAPLDEGASPRGINRGPMITEASDDELKAWLVQHGFLSREALNGA